MDWPGGHPITHPWIPGPSSAEVLQSSLISRVSAPGFPGFPEISSGNRKLRGTAAGEQTMVVRSDLFFNLNGKSVLTIQTYRSYRSSMCCWFAHSLQE